VAPIHIYHMRRGKAIISDAAPIEPPNSNSSDSPSVYFGSILPGVLDNERVLASSVTAGLRFLMCEAMSGVSEKRKIQKDEILFSNMLELMTITKR
jgi:hypothetical protein